MDVQAQVAAFVKACCTNGETLVLAVSGGMDSMCLLHALYGLQQAERLQNRLAVVHVHHGLREEADEDADLVRSYCRDLGISCTVERVQIDAVSGRGVEAAARDARYQVLVNYALSQANAVVVLAHHQSDQVETFLLRYARGSGLHGLSSMRADTWREGIRMLRPLLALPKETIRQYVLRYHVPYIEDQSNVDVRYSRNYLRHEVIPRLAHLQPNLEGVTTRLTDALQVDDDYLHEQAMHLYRQMNVQQIAGAYVLRREELLKAHRSLQRRLIHILLSCFTSEGWTFHHIDDVLQLTESDTSPSASIQLAHGLHVWRSYEKLYIGQQTPREEVMTRQWLWRLDEVGRLKLALSRGGWHFRRIPYTINKFEPPARSSLWRLYLPRIDVLDVHVGDVTSKRVRPLGMNGSKKLQDVFTDKKVPRHLRNVWPVFSVRGEVVWVPGLVRGTAHKLEFPHQSHGWVIFAHPNHLIRDEIGTLYRDARRMIME